jgi:XTP/dITP diphosphohydrolase
MSIPLLIATWNRGKIHEMKALLADMARETSGTAGEPQSISPTCRDASFTCMETKNQQGNLDINDAIFELLTLSDMDVKFRVAEDGESYVENAMRKALQYCQASGLLTLSDDSGLEVDALDGAPGLHSARYISKPDATDADRRQALVENLQSFAHPWIAHFRCTVVIAVPKNWRLHEAFTPISVVDGITLYQTEGICEGEIIDTERGSHGFGYDPIFQLAGTSQTMAELTMDEKNHLSHRAKAVKAAIPLLRKLTG